MEKPHIGISFEEPIPRSAFQEFENAVANDGLQMRIEGREKSGPFAGIEWLLPTAVILYISKSYFDAFLKEMGKDHYTLLKKGILSLRERFVSESAPRITLFSTQGKVRKNPNYSFAFSIVAEAANKRNFKLLIQDGATKTEYDQIVDAFLQFLDKHHSGELSAAMLAEIANARAVGGTILLALNYDTKELEVVDPVPRAPVH